MTKALFGIAILPMACLGIILLTGIVIVFALRRGTRAINEKVKEYDAVSVTNSSTNDRWSRGNQIETARSKANEIDKITCPACGGENTNGSTMCAFCGRAL